MNSIPRKAEELGLNASAGHILGCTWQSGGIIQKGEPHERNPCAPGFEEQPPSRLYQQRCVEWEKICKLKGEDNYVLFFCEGVRNTEDRMFIVDSGASMHNAEQGEFRSDTMDTLRRSKNPTCDLPRPVAAQVFVHDLDVFATVQLLDETTAILLLHQLCSKRGYSYERKTSKLHNWPKMGRQLLVQWTTQYFSLHQDCHQHRDQRISLIIPENWEHYQIQWQLEVTSMHAGNRCWQIMTCKPRGTVNQQTRRTRRIQCKAFLSGDCFSSQLIWRTWRYSANRKVWWFDNSRAQSPQRRTWISEQSPIRCRGTSSRLWVESV